MKQDNSTPAAYENKLIDPLVNLTNELVTLPENILRDFNTIVKVIEQSDLYLLVTKQQAENDQLRRDKEELLEVLKEAHKHLEDGDIYLSQPKWERMESAITKYELK